MEVCIFMISFALHSADMVASVLPEWNPRLKRFALTDLRRSLPALSSIRVWIPETADE